MEDFSEFKSAQKQNKDVSIIKEKDKKERKLKREKYITKGNINRWIFTLHSPEEIPENEMLDCLIEIFHFFSDSCWFIHFFNH